MNENFSKKIIAMMCSYINGEYNSWNDFESDIKDMVYSDED